IHSANPNPVKNHICDKEETMFQESLRMFYNFYNNRRLYGKMIYFGSGAEYDKSADIIDATEDDINKRIPNDDYGLAKLYMNELARNSENVYNFRLFGCYGPYDYKTKFLTHVINCCLYKDEITINQDCLFDYIRVSDVAGILCYAIDNELKYKDYNICSGKKILLSEIAERIKKKMKDDIPVRIIKDGLNKEYTGNNSRITEETGYTFMDIDTGIDLQIEHERSKIS
ncbi:MAG: NAD(P)-dependent oxidoreductase, partial [Lachnospiraceae bacterium]|nr:NAD(P)-dependent oxidoreductase [Lachnospiraceae bacterium]